MSFGKLWLMILLGVVTEPFRWVASWFRRK